MKKLYLEKVTPEFLVKLAMTMIYKEIKIKSIDLLIQGTKMDSDQLRELLLAKIETKMMKEKNKGDE